jgi:hypothetical protein
MDCDLKTMSRLVPAEAVFRAAILRAAILAERGAMLRQDMIDNCQEMNYRASEGAWKALWIVINT